MPDPNLPLLTTDEKVLLRASLGDHWVSLDELDKVPQASEYRPIFWGDVWSHKAPRIVEVTEVDIKRPGIKTHCGKLRVSRKHAKSLAAWIEAYPSIA